MSEVTQEDTFSAVVRLIDAGHRPVALDFASATNPGGGWRRGQRGTQEESLCHQSDLGTLLEKTRYPMGRDEARYVPRVTIHRALDGKALPKDKYRCAVIASELHAIAASSKNYLQDRVDALFALAVRNKHDVIVLGAWGCGAFGETEDDLFILAQAFRAAALNPKHSGVRPVYAMMNKKNATLMTEGLKGKKL